MKEPVGILSSSGIFSLKRGALMFERLGLPIWCFSVNVSKKAGLENRDVFAEIEWLMDNNIIFSPEDLIDEDKLRRDKEYLEYEKAANFVSEKASAAYQRLRDFDMCYCPMEEGRPEFKRINQVMNGLRDDLDKSSKRLHLLSGDVEARRVSIALKKLHRMDAIPIISNSNFSNDVVAEKADVIQIVVNTLPVPDDNTSWEQILEFRSDPDSYSKFLALRNWINEVARNKLTPLEVEQKLEYLMDQHRRHMKLHRMKTNTGMLETIVVSTAELVEDLVKIKWGKIAKGLFSFRQRKIALLEGELKSPGSEVAYVIKAQEAYSQRI
jgi:hypothetical protein